MKAFIFSTIFLLAFTSIAAANDPIEVLGKELKDVKGCSTEWQEVEEQSEDNIQTFICTKWNYSNKDAPVIPLVLVLKDGKVAASSSLFEYETVVDLVFNRIKLTNYLKESMGCEVAREDIYNGIYAYKCLTFSAVISVDGRDMVFLFTTRSKSGKGGNGIARQIMGIDWL